MLKYMLDTNIAIYVIKRRPPEALATFNQHAGQLCISSITLAELMHGVEKSAKPDHNLRQVEDFTSRLTVLEYGNKAASHYGDIRAVLERKGTPVGVNVGCDSQSWVVSLCQKHRKIMLKRLKRLLSDFKQLNMRSLNSFIARRNLSRVLLV